MQFDAPAGRTHEFACATIAELEQWVSRLINTHALRIEHTDQVNELHSATGNLHDRYRPHRAQSEAIATPFPPFIHNGTDVNGSVDHADLKWQQSCE